MNRQDIIYRLFKSGDKYTIAGRIKGRNKQTHIVTTEFKDVAQLIYDSFVKNAEIKIDSLRWKDGNGINFYINGVYAHRIFGIS